MANMRYRDAKSQVENLEKKAQGLIKNEKWKEAKHVMDIAVKTAKKGDSLVYVEEIRNKHKMISREQNPYREKLHGFGYDRASYMLSLLVVFGLLIFFYNVTGNVVGDFKGGFSIVSGLIFIFIGIIAYFVFKLK